MGKKCFIPGCKSGYTSSKEKISMFSAPKSEELLAKWRKAVRRLDRSLTSKDFLCAKHFRSDEIITEWTATLHGKVVHTSALKVPKLAKDAVPSIFPSYPKYLSKPDKVPRKRPAERSPIVPVKKKKTSGGNRKTNADSETTVPEEENTNTSNATPTKEKSYYFEDLEHELQDFQLPDKWGIHISSDNPKCVSISEMKFTQGKRPYILKQITISDDMKWRVFVLDKNIDLEDVSDSVVRNLADVEELLSIVDSQQACNGGPWKSKYPDVQLKKAYVDSAGKWRHVNCEIVCTDGAKVCYFCNCVPDTLRIHQKRKTAKQNDAVPRVLVYF